MFNKHIYYRFQEKCWTKFRLAEKVGNMEKNVKSVKEPKTQILCHDYWLIDYLIFYAPLKNISLIWRRNHCRWRAAKFKPMLGAQGLWAGRGLYRVTPTVTQDLDFSGFIRKTATISRLLRHAWGCRKPILTRNSRGLCHEIEPNLSKDRPVHEGEIYFSVNSFTHIRIFKKQLPTILI